MLCSGLGLVRIRKIKMIRFTILRTVIPVLVAIIAAILVEITGNPIFLSLTILGIILAILNFFYGESIYNSWRKKVRQ